MLAALGSRPDLELVIYGAHGWPKVLMKSRLRLAEFECCFQRLI